MNMQQKQRLIAEIEEAFARGPVLIALNPRIAGVKVPDYLREQFPLVLRLSPRFGSQFPMKLTPRGIEARLTFKGTPTDVFVPWTALAGVQFEERGELVPVPSTRSTEASKKRGYMPEQPKAGNEYQRGHLRVIQGGRR